MKTKTGDIFEIFLELGTIVYAQALASPEFAFFDLSPAEISNRSPLFRIWVHKSAIRDWKKIGNRTPSPDLLIEIPRFKQDPIDGTFSIYQGGKEQKASLEQIQGLECAAVWEGPHIRDRLTDHLAGRKNKWLETMRPRANG